MFVNTNEPLIRVRRWLSRSSDRVVVRCWVIASLSFFVVVLSACATGPKIVNHAFGFDARIDTPKFECSRTLIQVLANRLCRVILRYANLAKRIKEQAQTVLWRWGTPST